MARCFYNTTGQYICKSVEHFTPTENSVESNRRTKPQYNLPVFVEKDLKNMSIDETDKQISVLNGITDRLSKESDNARNSMNAENIDTNKKTELNNNIKTIQLENEKINEIKFYLGWRKEILGQIKWRINNIDNSVKQIIETQKKLNDTGMSIISGSLIPNEIIRNEYMVSVKTFGPIFIKVETNIQTYKQSLDNRMKTIINSGDQQSKKLKIDVHTKMIMDLWKDLLDLSSKEKQNIELLMMKNNELKKNLGELNFRLLMNIVNGNMNQNLRVMTSSLIKIINNQLGELQIILNNLNTQSPQQNVNTSVPSQPVPNKPVPTQPILTQPVPSQPVPSQPVQILPVPTQPVPNKPVQILPIPTQPVLNIRTLSETTPIQPVLNKPTLTQLTPSKPEQVLQPHVLPNQQDVKIDKLIKNDDLQTRMVRNTPTNQTYLSLGDLSLSANFNKNNVNTGISFEKLALSGTVCYTNNNSNDNTKHKSCFNFQ